MAAWIFGLILAIIFVIVNGCTQVFYAQKKGYKIKPTAFAYFVGAVGNLISGNIVPISAQAETITVSGEIKNERDRVAALLIAAVIGIVFGATGLTTKIVDFAGTSVIYGMMAGVGLILCVTSIDMFKTDWRTCLISLVVAIGVYMLTKDVVYTIAASVLLSVLDFTLLRKKRVDVVMNETTEWRFWKREYWKEFQPVKPRFSVWTILGALSLVCLNIGSNISFGTISASMAGAQPNFDAITLINSLADIPSVMFGGMPLETIISGTASTHWPLLAGVLMMVISGILLMCGVMNKLSKFIPAESICGFLFVIGFSSTIVPNMMSVVSSDKPLAGIVSMTVTALTKNAFFGIVVGVLATVSGNLWGLI